MCRYAKLTALVAGTVQQSFIDVRPGTKSVFDLGKSIQISDSKKFCFHHAFTMLSPCFDHQPNVQKQNY